MKILFHDFGDFPLFFEFTKALANSHFSVVHCSVGLLPVGRADINLVQADNYKNLCLSIPADYHSVKQSFIRRFRMEWAYGGQLRSIVEEPNKSKFYYPNIAERFARYEPWISDTSVVALKFEDLRGPEASIWVRHIVKTHWSANAESYDLEAAVLKCSENMNPERSHTFNKGRSGGWKNAFDEELKDLFKKVAGDLLIRLGYEKDHNW